MSQTPDNSNDRNRMISAGGKTSWNFQAGPVQNGDFKITVEIATGPDFENAPDWIVNFNDAAGELWGNYCNGNEIVAAGAGKKPKEFNLEVIAPKGARYGDEVYVDVILEYDGIKKVEEFRASAKQSLMILKTQMDQEKSVVDSLSLKAKDGEKDIFAILSPANLRGYIFVEGMNTERLKEKTRDIKKARAFVDDKSTGKTYSKSGRVTSNRMSGETTLDEIDKYLTPLSTVVGIVEGDLVELINGPFKGERARVQHIDGNKEEITVELIEAMVPIPVTVKGDSVRIIEKEK